MRLTLSGVAIFPPAEMLIWQAYCEYVHVASLIHPARDFFANHAHSAVDRGDIRDPTSQQNVRVSANSGVRREGEGKGEGKGEGRGGAGGGGRG